MNESLEKYVQRITEIYNVIVTDPSRKLYVLSEINEISEEIKAKFLPSEGNPFHKVFLICTDAFQFQIKSFLLLNQEKIVNFDRFFSFITTEPEKEKGEAKISSDDSLLGSRGGGGSISGMSSGFSEEIEDSSSQNKQSAPEPKRVPPPSVQPVPTPTSEPPLQPESPPPSERSEEIDVKSKKAPDVESASTTPLPPPPPSPAPSSGPSTPAKPPSSPPPPGAGGPKPSPMAPGQPQEEKTSIKEVVNELKNNQVTPNTEKADISEKEEELRSAIESAPSISIKHEKKKGKRSAPRKKSITRSSSDDDILAELDTSEDNYGSMAMDFEDTEDEMEVPEEVEEEVVITTDKRDILVDYYSKMNLNKIYKFNIKLSKEKLIAKRKVRDVLTGEQKEQVADQIEVVEDLPIEVELMVPGAYVSPAIQYVSPKIDEVTTSFYVNPLVKYKDLEAKLVLGQKKLGKKEINLPVSVNDNRIVKILSLLGMVVAFIPSLWPVLFNVNMNDQIRNSLGPSSELFEFFTSERLILVELGIGALFVVIALLFYRLYSGTRAKFNAKETL